MARKPSKVLSPAEKKTQVATARLALKGLKDDLQTNKRLAREAKAAVRVATKIANAAEREVVKQQKAVTKAADAIKGLTAK